MIINTGSRTDTVQYYTPWLLKRFEEGFVYSRNPLFPDKVTRYELNPEVVDCVVFCSKNYKPILPYIKNITDKFNTYFFYTITPYGKDVEPNVPDVNESIETLIELSEIVGAKRLAWRYDPVLLTGKYTKQLHYEMFNSMAEKIAKHIDRCIFSFVEMYKKLKNNMPEIIPLSEQDKAELAQNFAILAKTHNIILQTCAAYDDYAKYGINISGCITSEILGKANGIKFKKLQHTGNRKGCGCIENRNIGDYNTCPNGCKYCYANQNPRIAKLNFEKHYPDSPLILGDLNETDEIKQSSQKSFIIQYEQQKLLPD